MKKFNVILTLENKKNENLNKILYLKFYFHKNENQYGNKSYMSVYKSDKYFDEEYEYGLYDLRYDDRYDENYQKSFITFWCENNWYDFDGSFHIFDIYITDLN